MNGQCVLITGAAGFIGANLARKLIDSRSYVHALVRPDTSLWRIEDLRNRIEVHYAGIDDCARLKILFENIRPDVIFNLAVDRAESSAEERRQALHNNVVGTLNLIEAANSVGYRRLIHFSSSSEYGISGHAFRESDHLRPVSFHGASKGAATIMCQYFARRYKKPIVILRLFRTYGYWDSPTSLVPTVIMAALRNRPLKLTVPGYSRDYVFVEDVLRACVLAAGTDFANGQLINIGSGVQIANEEIVYMVEQATGAKINVSIGAYPPRPWDALNYVADNREALNILGWRPTNDIKTGIEKTVVWFRKNLKYYAPEA